jgi:hypothetical protein
VDRAVTPRTRHALLLGAGGLALVVVVGLLVVLVVRSFPTAPPAQPTSSAAPPPAASPATTSAAPTQPAAPAPRPDPERNECVDALGDAAVDLDSVQLALEDGELVAQFRFAELPAGVVGLGLNVERSGDRSYLLGVALDDGEVDRVFVQDFDKSHTDELDTDGVRVDGTTVTAVFPREALKRVGTNWRWSAFATAAGADPDLCPDSQQLELER